MIGKKRLNVFGRRRFLEVAAGALATTQLATGQVANAGLVLDKPFKLAQSETPGSFSAVKQVDAGVLDVGYVEAGPTDGPTAILLHGWPYDIHSFDEVTPRLAAAGFHVIVPYARGYGSTSFLSSGTPRTGQPSALAVDTIALMDALNIKQATIAGFDWGARTADIVAALWPDRVKGIVSVSGYLIGSQEAGKMPCRRRPSFSGGINTILRQSVVAKVTPNTGGNSPSWSGSSHLQSGNSTTRHSLAARQLSTIQITSIS
jgi:pimeloyl-ACP methyl ester carboxylesterase